jgi:hypothetical protein
MMIGMKKSATIILLLTVCMPCFADTSSEISNRYHAAKTQQDRLLICIEAINEGVIAKGKNVDVLREIFDGDGVPPSFGIPKAGERELVTVFFNKNEIRRDSKANSAAALSGWYFCCWYDESKKITKYYITNSPYWQSPLGNGRQNQ